MARSITDARQVTLRQFLSQITNAATYAGTADSKPANQAEIDNLLAAINDEVTPLLRLSASSTPNLVVTVGAAVIANSESSYQRSIPHIGALLPNSFTSGTITFPSSSGGTITVSPGNNATLTVSSGNFIKVLIYMDSTGALNVLTGTQNAVEASATVTAAPKSTLPIGYVTLQNVAGTIQNVAQNKIYQFGTGAGGSGSGSGSGVGDDLDALLFRASFTDKFDEGPTDSASAVDVTTAKTDATAYSFAKAMYTLNYDASKTIAAGTTTTNINLSSNAAYTVKTGDVVIANNQARKITAVASQSSFTTEAFSVAPTLASQVTVSQAVHTKDVYNLAVDGAALSAAFSGATFQDVMVDYEDTSAAGDNIFDVNTTPVVAMSGSADGTTFSDNKLRATLETDTINSFLLPAAGTGLYLRFFANQTSGSGIVNILGYRAFMQKTTSAVAGGITNSAYAFTNSVGTPVNCSVSVVGGKTTLTLTWQYAMGVYSGTSASSIEVWLNGQKLPRFINATLTPDGSFLETSTNVVTLDRDYSSQNLSVEVFQRTQIVDNSTVNTTNIAYQQEIMQNGFQAFVNQNQLMNATTSVGTPAAGTFYSSIIGRASIPDLSQDLKVRMGVERVSLQQISQLQNEFGPNLEQVWSTPNDLFGQVRFVGAWQQTISTDGVLVLSSISGDFLEITFYGTGLNLLTLLDSSRDYRVSIDGGAEGGQINAATGSNALRGRNYNSNQVINIVSGLSLGVHTAKIRSNATGGQIAMSGYEILTEASTLKINPGIGYVNGQKLTLSSIQSPTYNSSFETGTLGTVGGRVLFYQKSDSTVAKAVTPTGSQANLASADHTNEEMVRTYNFREFGAARSDDFSLLTSTAGSKSFTLNDGTTTLVGSSVFASLVSSVSQQMFTPNTTNDYFTFTFVGTGLDIRGTSELTSGTLSTYSVIVDGVSLGAMTLSQTTLPRLYKIASGLPYGTHSVKITCTAVNTTRMYWDNFIVYQPKKPSLPSGAIELADYNVMANFTFPTIATDDTNRSGGTLAKTSYSEVNYNGAGWATTAGVGEAFGTLTSSSTAGNYVEYTFWGTGIVFIARSGGVASTATIQIDGSAYTGSAGAIGTGNSWTPGTSTYTMGAAANSNGSLQITGLTLGLHKIRATVATNNVRVYGFEVITPIHSVRSNVYSDLQNILPVGSCGLSDNRKTTPVKESLSIQKFRAQALGIASGPTTTSTAAVPMPDMSLTVRSSGSWFLITYSATTSKSADGSETQSQVYVNGVAIGLLKQERTNAANSPIYVISDQVITYLPAGTHKVDLYWSSGGGSTLTASGTNRSLTAVEL